MSIISKAYGVLIRKNPTDKAARFGKTTTVHQARLQIFQPTRRPKLMERIIDTPYGVARIDGKLGQQHADFIEAIFYYRFDLKILDDKRIAVFVDPYKIRTSMSEQYSYKGMEVISTDIMKAIIDLKIKYKGIRIMGHIIDKIEESTTFLKDNPFNRDEKRPIWIVTFSDTFAKLMYEDLQVNYNPTLIARLDTGIAQAITRWCLGQKNTPNGGWKLDNLIEAVGGVDKNSHPQTIKDRRLDVRKDTEKMKSCGILVENYRVFLSKNTLLSK